MHSYTAEQAAAADFDMTLLQVDDVETAGLVAKISKIRSNLEAKKKAAAGSGSNGYHWVSDDEVISSCDFLGNPHFLSMVFSSDFCYKISSAISGQKRYVSWYVSARLNSWVTCNPVITNKLLFTPNIQENIKCYIINNNLVQTEELIEAIKNKSALTFPISIQERLLEISEPEDAAIFVDSPYDKIRLSAYKKIGPLSHLDIMIKDPHALIRKYAVRLLSPGDQRLASFINDRSQDVFIQALSKISLPLVPMMLGSSHLKKKRAKEVLNHRLQSAQG
jgi:hypothetical protein